MKGQIQLVLATIGLTVLIWVYADQQGYKTVRLQVAVTVGTPPGVVAHVTGAAPDAGQTLHVTVYARGPNAAIRELPSRPPALEVTVPITENVATDESRALDIHDPLAAALRERGLQLLGVNPASMSVRFDRLVKVDVQLQADAGAFHQALAGAVQIDPPVVTASVLASQLAGAPAPAENRLVIPIEAELRNQPGETEFDFPVSLKTRTWNGLDVKWQPELVHVKGKLQQLYTDLELKLIPLRAMLPWDWPSDRYEIVWVDDRDRLQKVHLKVPVGKPNVLTNNDVVAFVSIDGSLIPPATPQTTQPATEPSPFTQTVRFVFPPGFEDVRIVSPPSTVKFRIVPRVQAKAAPESG
ncbi:MAG TPA: hypothetical protein PLV57_08740 [Phycisphaerae bacterium]|nr:hypothetical protein [Phycisphaerae bacterium]HOJ72919.1 hypothetical protein [Phycisphaerae bacterium]HOM50103.1 hypothetical protein [Phycisphaerae bacterium]HPP26594.1 hypothetical protein [Phycisphaerae bacterium]